MNIIKEVENIIQKAINEKASDIHILDYYGKAIIEYRINGLLIKQVKSINNINEIISRIKILAKLNVAEKRMPQDGNISFDKYDLRVCTMPSISGENVVIRILNSYLSNIDLDSLGFRYENIQSINKAISKNNGLILITGATGSGKSTTLLSLTNMLNTGTKKIISIEDPVENKIYGVVQIQVNEEIGLDFPNILKSCLRSDPDIIIISEIRDELTAQIAVRASLTGHLVLATLHTNDCISTFSRLIDMGVPKYLILDSILLIISQRLLNSSNNKNIKNRLLINETLYMDEKTKEIFNKYSLKSEIKEKLLANGFITMEDDANLKGFQI